MLRMLLPLALAALALPARAATQVAYRAINPDPEAGRPILLRARMSGQGPSSAQVYASYRIEPAGDRAGDDADYVHVQLEPQRGGGFEAWLRPGVGGIPLEGEHVLRYFLQARSPEGAVLDE